jgi:predicted sulfurtransferase
VQYLAKRLRALWEPFGALGRVYVASEGINAQMAVPCNVLKNFEAACRCACVHAGQARRRPEASSLPPPFAACSAPPCHGRAWC